MLASAKCRTLRGRRRARAWRLPLCRSRSRGARRRRLRAARSRLGRRSGPSAATRSIARRSSSKAGRVELVASTRGGAPGRSNRVSRPSAIASRESRTRSASLVHPVQLGLGVGDGGDAARTPVAPASWSTSAMFSTPRCEPQTTPTLEPGGSRADLVDQATCSPGPTSIATTGTRPGDVAPGPRRHGTSSWRRGRSGSGRGGRGARRGARG